MPVILNKVKDLQPRSAKQEILREAQDDSTSSYRTASPPEHSSLFQVCFKESLQLIKRYQVHAIVEIYMSGTRDYTEFFRL